ncbi:MAG: hypothetical protein JF587_01785 [Catenulisporales bacterium]|nr:hypothetical protein [Catenulisporales bacterium]
MSMDIDADSPAAGGSTPAEAPPERRRDRPEWLRRDVFGVDAVVGLLLTVPLVIGLASHIRWGALYPPDSRYYVTMALRDMGESPADALTQQLKVTGSPAESWYFSSADPVWRMVQPRMLYPLLSVPFVWMFGVSVGMAVVPALAMVVAVLAAARLVQRRYGPFAALAAAGALAATGIATWLAMAITDSLAVALVALMLLRLPLGRRSSGRDLVWLTVYALGLCMTRQCAPMAAGLVCGGWLWAFLFPPAATGTGTGRRRVRNQWLAPAAAVTGASVAGQLAFSWAYPYNATQQFLYAGDQPTLRDALLHLPSLSWSLARAEVVNMLHNDRYLLVLMTAPLVYAMIHFRDELVGVFLGGLAGTAVLVLANGIPSGMRYESVLAPVAVLVFGALMHRFGPAALRGGPVVEIPRPAGPAPSPVTPTGEPRREVLRIGGLAGAGLAVLVGIVAWSATHGSRSMVAAVRTSPAAAAAVAGSGHAVLPTNREPAELILQDGLSQAEIMSRNGYNWLAMVVDWRHPLRYRPLRPSDPGWSHRTPDGTAVIRFGDFTLPQQMRFGAALSLQNTVKPETLKVLRRRASLYGEDVVFQVADHKGREHTGRATVLYPLRPLITGLITQLVFDS